MSFPSPRFPPQAYPAAPLGDQRNRMRLPTPESEDLDLQTNSSWSGDEAVEFIIGNTGEAFLYSFEECKTRQGMEAFVNDVLKDALLDDPSDVYYRLIDSDGKTILPRAWEGTVKPGWSITIHTPGAPSPPFTNSPPASSFGGVSRDHPPEQKEPIEFVISNTGERFTSSFEDCKTQQGMEAFVKDALKHTFPNDPGDLRYKLIDSNEKIILPRAWEGTVKPGWHITIQTLAAPTSPLINSPPTSTTGGVSKDHPPEQKAPLEFVIGNTGERFPSSFEDCKTQQGMEAFVKDILKHAFPNDPGDLLYKLIEPDGKIILPRAWEGTVKPGWRITIHIPVAPTPKTASLPQSTQPTVEKRSKKAYVSYGRKR